MLISRLGPNDKLQIQKPSSCSALNPQSPLTTANAGNGNSFPEVTSTRPDAGVGTGVTGETGVTSRQHQQPRFIYMFFGGAGGLELKDAHTRAQFRSNSHVEHLYSV